MDQSHYDEFENETSDDFEFVISANGDLKSVVIPPEFIDSPPERVQIILEIFGIDNIKELVHRVLH